MMAHGRAETPLQRARVSSSNDRLSHDKGASTAQWSTIKSFHRLTFSIVPISLSRNSAPHVHSHAIMCHHTWYSVTPDTSTKRILHDDDDIECVILGASFRVVMTIIHRRENQQPFLCCISSWFSCLFIRGIPSFFQMQVCLFRRIPQALGCGFFQNCVPRRNEIYMTL